MANTSGDGIVLLFKIILAPIFLCTVLFFGSAYQLIIDNRTRYNWVVTSYCSVLILAVLIIYLRDDPITFDQVFWLYVVAWVGLGIFKIYKTRMAALPEVVRGGTVIDAAAIIKEQKQELARLAHAEGQPRNEDLYLKFGGVIVNSDVECEHFLIAGKTGAGKTQAINGMMASIYKRANSNIIIADPGGGYYSRFGSDDDLILNPLDERSVAWSPFAEIRKYQDCSRLAKSVIPDSAGNKSEWKTYGQTFLAQLLRVQWQSGDHSIKELLRLLGSALPDELEVVLADTPAAPFVSKDNVKMLASIRSTVAPFVACWEYLPDDGEFSVRDWLQSVVDINNPKPGNLYITYSDDQLAETRGLIACYLELAILETLGLTESKERRVFFIFDELDALGAVPSLRAGVSRLRKYGGACVVGIQTVAQIRDTYGKDGAQTLLSCLSNKLLLAAGDNDTADYFSREIGEQETRSETKSTSANSEMGATNSVTIGTDRRVERVVLSAEIMNLPNLSGYLKIVGLPIIRIDLDYQEWPELNKPMERF